MNSSDEKNAMDFWYVGYA